MGAIKLATSNRGRPAAAAAVPAQFNRAQQHQRALFAKINIARQQLSMAEDDYRQILFDETGATSLRALNERQLEQVLARMTRLGFRALPKKGAKSAGAQHPMARKARALWISLYQLGVVQNPGEPALEAFAARQLGCERLVWARQSDANKLIEALKAMATRAGWVQYDRTTGQRLSSATLQISLCHVILAKLLAAEAVPADWTLETAALRLCGISTADHQWPFRAEHFTRLASKLGDKLRELAA